MKKIALIIAVLALMAFGVLISGRLLDTAAGFVPDNYAFFWFVLCMHALWAATTAVTAVAGRRVIVPSCQH